MATIQQITPKDRETVLTVQEDLSVRRCTEIMRRGQIGCLIVVRDKEMVGIVTERDVCTKVVARRLDPDEITAGEVMTESVVFCGMDTSISRAQQIMARNEIRHLPVIENGVPLGMISSRDILAHQLASVKAIARRQSRLLSNLEREFPGITAIEKDGTGRVVI